MKKISITDEVIIAFLIAAILVIGCSKSVVVDKNERLEPTLETYTPRTKADTTEVNDSVPITFSVEVEGWKEIVINP